MFFVCLMCLFVALFKLPPLALVVPHQRLVIEAVDFHWHRLDILRERKHRSQRLIVEKPQPRHRIARHLKRRRARERISPQPKTRHRRVVRPHEKTRRLERADDAPVRVARKHRRRRLHRHCCVLSQPRFQQTIKGITLVPENKQFRSIEIGEFTNYNAWGVVTCVIHIIDPALLAHRNNNSHVYIRDSQ